MVHPKKLLRIISLEDSLVDCELVLNELSRHGRELVFKRITTATELVEELKSHSWDIVISDYHLHGLTTREALHIVRTHSSELPFILFSGRIGEEGVADLMKAGVEDVVMKSRPERLFPVVKRVLREAEIRHKESLANKVAQEALKAKEQMLAIVSHDIKNPLFAIQLEAEMLLRAVERNAKSLFSEEVKIQSGRILKTTERMKGLITDLLDKNKKENNLTHLTRIDVDASKILQESLDALRPLINEKEIQVKLKLPDEGVVAHLDRNKMFQVFSNLLNNAIKYTPHQGTIQLQLEDLEHEFAFRVTDSGPGLTQEACTKVFEKYWTAEDSEVSGTGLGLYICKTIVEAHEGKIFAENHEERGASFWLLLPKDICSAGRMTFPHLGASPDQNKKIYIVDDDEDLREVISWALGKEGYTIHSFHNPHEALKCLRAGRHLPHLIVVDFHMDEMKGSEFLMKKNEIREVMGCPVLMISASPQEVYRDVNPDHYKEVITKPIDLEGLVNNIRKHLS